MSTTIGSNTGAALTLSDRIDAKAAAELLGVALPTVYRAVREHRVPHYRIGRVVRFSKKALEQFMATGGTSHAA